MFDPYRKWLGIPEDSRPPTHYQLLGIGPDEKDADVINAAVVRQSAYVRNFQTGPHADDATRILNEIAAAKVCLLDPVKRALYNVELKKKQAPAAPPGAKRAAPPAAMPAAPPADGGQSRRAGRPGGRSVSSPPPAAGAQPAAPSGYPANSMQQGFSQPAMLPPAMTPPVMLQPGMMLQPGYDPLAAPGAAPVAPWAMPGYAGYGRRSNLMLWLFAAAGGLAIVLLFVVILVLMSGDDDQPIVASGGPPPVDPTSAPANPATGNPDSAARAAQAGSSGPATNDGGSPATGGPVTSGSSGDSPASRDFANGDSARSGGRPGQPSGPDGGDGEPAQGNNPLAQGSEFSLEDNKRDDGIRGLAISPNGRFLLAYSADRNDTHRGALRVWNVETGREAGSANGSSRFEREITPWGAAVFIADGLDIVAARLDRMSVHRYAGVALNGDRVASSFEARDCDVVALAPGGDLIAMAGPEGIFVSEVHDNDPRWGKITTFDAAVRSLAISPSKRYITSVHEDRSVHTWSASGGKEAYKPWEHTAQVSQAAYTPDGLSVVAVCQDGAIRKWTAAKGTEEWLVTPSEVKQLNCLSFQPAGSRFITGGADGWLRIWNTADGAMLQSHQADEKNSLAAVALSPDGRLAVTATATGRIRRWNLADLPGWTPPPAAEQPQPDADENPFKPKTTRNRPGE
jgi:hypothetical protein